MPAREAALWKIMRGSGLPGDWVRVENRVESGTPDVNFCLPFAEGEGWIELKSIERFPVDPSLPFRIHHFTKQQRFWLRRRERMGGVAALLLRVERAPREYLLLSGEWAARSIGEATAREAREAAAAVWGPSWDRRAFLGGLRKLLELVRFRAASEGGS